MMELEEEAKKPTSLSLENLLIYVTCHNIFSWYNWELCCLHFLLPVCWQWTTGKLINLKLMKSHYFTFSSDVFCIISLIMIELFSVFYISPQLRKYTETKHRDDCVHRLHLKHSNLQWPKVCQDWKRKKKSNKALQFFFLTLVTSLETTTKMEDLNKSTCKIHSDYQSFPVLLLALYFPLTPWEYYLQSFKLFA